MQLDYMLGNNYAHTSTSNSFVSGHNEIVSYGKSIFTKFDIKTKQAQQVPEENCDPHAR